MVIKRERQNKERWRLKSKIIYVLKDESATELHKHRFNKTRLYIYHGVILKAIYIDKLQNWFRTITAYVSLHKIQYARCCSHTIPTLIYPKIFALMCTNMWNYWLFISILRYFWNDILQTTPINVDFLLIGPLGKISMIFEWKLDHVHFRRYVWQFRLWNGNHFVSCSMSWFNLYISRDMEMLRYNDLWRSWGRELSLSVERVCSTKLVGVGQNERKPPSVFCIVCSCNK